jgi:hypothetical protein
MSFSLISDMNTQRLEATMYNSSNPTFLYEFCYFIRCLTAAAAAAAAAAAGLELPIVRVF